MARLPFLILTLTVAFNAFTQKQISNVDRTIVRQCFQLENDQTAIIAITNNDYDPSEFSRHGTSNLPNEFKVYVIDSNLNVVTQYLLNEDLLQYTNFSINNTMYINGQIVFTGRGIENGTRLRFTGTLNMQTGELIITDEITFQGTFFDYDANPFEINDSLIGVVDYLLSGGMALHVVDKFGDVESTIYDSSYDKGRTPFYGQMLTDSVVCLREASRKNTFFDINTLEFTETTQKQYLGSLPAGVAVTDGTYYYMFGAWVGVDDDGYYDQGWNSSRAFDMFLYTFDKKFNLLSKAEITDKEWYQQIFTEHFSTQSYVLDDTTLKVVYTSFPDVTATSDKDHMTSEKFEDSKLTFATVDLQGNLIDKKEYFENDGKNHFNWNLIPNNRGYLLVNTVLDVSEFPDTTTNLELMQLDKKGVVLGVKTISNKNVSRLKLYPNPAQSQGKVNLSWSGMEKQNWQVKLYDNQGRLVHATDILQGVSETHLQLPELPRGNYIIRAEGSGKQLHTGTLVVE